MICIYWPVRTKCARPADATHLTPILQAPDCKDLLQWLAAQPLARHLQSQQGQDLLLVHAGVLPSWSLQARLWITPPRCRPNCAVAICPNFLQQMYGNAQTVGTTPWSACQRWRVIVNALTRLRFCNALGHMDFSSSEAASAAPAGLMPLV